ncbi:MAG: glycerate kinase [Bacteroidota bacterium]|nr:glycerate kinase [Bacteroidota bacterium]
MLNILICPNSFKECADSVRIAHLMNESFSKLAKAKYNTEVNTFVRPISDGGDGFLSVCREVFQLELISYEVSAPYKEEKVKTQMGYSKNNGTVYIESADVLGLKLIPLDKRHPLFLSSRGMGELLQKLIGDHLSKKRIISKVVVGIGGTGTSDFGLGMSSVLGLEIYDENMIPLEPLPVNLKKVRTLKWEKPKIPFEIEVVLDVNSPLLGPKGAAMTFARQKGASEGEITFLEEGTSSFVDLLNKTYPESSSKRLMGAGGGLSGAFKYFLDAEYKSSEDFVRGDLSVNSGNFNIDMVVTGEGSFDEQTLLKKGAMIVIEEFKGKKTPVYICAGKVEKPADLESFSNLHFIDISKYFTNSKESIENIDKGIFLAADEALKRYFSEKVSS